VQQLDVADVARGSGGGGACQRWGRGGSERSAPPAADAAGLGGRTTV
jgi:hypothetical protein